MIYVGIDCASDKHDCVIVDESNNNLTEVFTITNNKSGYNELLERINAALTTQKDKGIKIGLEATGHYSINLCKFLVNNKLIVYELNPLIINMFKKGITLRKTKTDRVDACTIANMLILHNNLKPYTDKGYHINELKSLTRNRFFKINELAECKRKINRLVDVIFPELKKCVRNIHSVSIYAMLKKYPSVDKIAAANLTSIANLLNKASKGQYKKEKAIQIKNAAKDSIGHSILANEMELKQTIQIIEILQAHLKEIETSIEMVMKEIDSVIVTIDGIGVQMAAVIISEIGDFTLFDSPDKILAFTGMAPSIYQSGRLVNGPAHIEKRGSRYLRNAFFNAARNVSLWNPIFKDYLKKKLEEGKHYYVALTHVIKKLVRVIFAMEKTGEVYRSARKQIPLAS